ncbi:MAG: hypothetical protein QOI66_5323 [Myxococcales bacterium]|jgi:hypothetical protein|nr:hypothetical protein [Myxococcales bacterium]
MKWVPSFFLLVSVGCTASSSSVTTGTGGSVVAGTGGSVGAGTGGQPADDAPADQAQGGGGGAVTPGDGPQTTPVDGGLDATVDGNGNACLPSNPKPPAVPCGDQGGTMCALPDGSMGICLGSNGCHDRQRDAAFCGSRLVACAPGGRCEGGVCKYDLCTGANTNGVCTLPGGGPGVCCGGSCQALDLQSDAKNCGGCGIVCPSNAACMNGGCVLNCDYNCPGGGSTCGTCPTAFTCGTPTLEMGASCSGLACRTCLLQGCAAGSDGLPCRIPGDAFEGASVCCNQACALLLTDPQNCGGCGIHCCSGVCVDGQCS